ncbi:hypothetical protein D3C76_1185270 [compost metagenome]
MANPLAASASVEALPPGTTIPSNMIDGIPSMEASTGSCLPAAVFTGAEVGPSSIGLALCASSALTSLSTLAASTPSATNSAILRPLIPTSPGWFIWLKALDCASLLPLTCTVPAFGAGNPRFAATAAASFRSMFARTSFTSRWRMASRSTLPSSKL